MATASTRALVLTGGGTAGGAWMAGLVDTLRAKGCDLAEADLIVGTSAGARTGAQLATGTLADVTARYRRAGFPLVQLPALLRGYPAAVRSAIAGASSRQEAARRIANLPPLGSVLVPAAERRHEVSAQLPIQDWPARKLVLAAVDAESGGRVTFDANSGVALLDAVMASGNVPGIHALVEIGGRRYADGGVHSAYNVDLAAGHDLVVVIGPIRADPEARAELDAQIAALGTAIVHVITADDASFAAIGANTGHQWPAAIEAGAVQAGREIGKLQEIWPPA